MAQWVSLNTNQFNQLIDIFNPSTSGGELIDCTELINNHQSSVPVNVTKDSIQYLWTYGVTPVGCSSVLPTPLTGAKSIKGTVTTGDNYINRVGYAEHLLLSIGVRPVLDTTSIVFTSNVHDFLAIQSISESNVTISIELDLSGISDTVYLYILAHGWNAIFTDLEIFYDDGTSKKLLDILNSIDTDLQIIDADLKDIASAIREGAQ